MEDYPHFFLIENGRLCSTDQHCLRFPRVLYGTLICLGYNREVPIYRCCLSMVDGLDICETIVMIPLNLAEPWMGTVINSKPDTTVEQMTHVALTSLYESRLAATAAMPIELFPIWNQENPVWKQRLEAVSDLEGPTSTSAWLRWPSTCNTCSTCSITPPELSCNSVCAWSHTMSATPSSHVSSSS
jgi:hypothetical protein